MVMAMCVLLARFFKFVELDKMEDGNAIRYELSQDTGRTSVPQIWIGGEFVGGCNDGARFVVFSSIQWRLLEYVYIYSSLRCILRPCIHNKRQRNENGIDKNTRTKRLATGGLKENFDCFSFCFFRLFVEVERLAGQAG